jgi:hypothetical protein
MWKETAVSYFKLLQKWLRKTTMTPSHLKYDRNSNRMRVMQSLMNCTGFKWIGIVFSGGFLWKHNIPVLHETGTFLTSWEIIKQSRYTPWKRLGGEGVQLLLIHDLGTRWGWVVSITPRPRCTPGGQDPRYPLERRLGGPQSRSEHRG